VLLGGYMVFYQTILWSLSRLRSLKIVFLGLLAIVFITLGFLPSFPHAAISEGQVIEWVAGLSLIAFLIAWVVVARQRSGGGSRRDWLQAPLERIAAGLPRRTSPFRSPAGAQFWFEWRRSGFVLPCCIGAVLLLIIGPLSWALQSEAASTFRIFVAVLAMPMILALPVGKAFSKPDFWSADLSLSAFIAVRPLATDEMVEIKAKVAALSAAISWLLALAFLSIWLPLWANPDWLIPVQRAVSQIYGSVYPLYATAALSILAGVFLTWGFLVSGFWIGLSGNRKLFAASAVPYALAPLWLVFLAVLLDPKTRLGVWIRHDPDRLFSYFIWVAALAVIAKFGLGAFFWRRVSMKRVRRYSLIWIGGTLCLTMLAILLWGGLGHVLQSDPHRVKTVMIFAVLLAVPFARLGLAPASLGRNRHR
jgi:hypothetical protein